MMNIDPDRIFDHGFLFLWEEKSLLRAESEINPLEVTSIRVGAKCYSSIGLEYLYGRIAIYVNVKEIEFADDRIKDSDMPVVERRISELFPLAKFKWGYDALVGGKHGR